MNNEKIKKEKWTAPYFCFGIILFAFAVLFIQFSYISLSKEVYGINMKEFASNRNTVTSTLTAKRGTIYDIEGNVLAENISTYTLIAYLDSSRTVDEDDPKHVIDADYTATKLASILGEENYDYILERLNKKSKQVEFGSVGKNLTELTKLAIEELDLPGIDFIETTKRYYPNGNFASYIVGYAKQYTRINIKLGEEYDLYDYFSNYFDNYDNVKITSLSDEFISISGSKIKALKKGSNVIILKTGDDVITNMVVNVIDYDIYNDVDSTIVGELGIEKNYNDTLEGVDGYTKYQQDKYGYKIPDTPEETVEAEDGYDIYLTIDSNIQRFAENAVAEIQEYNTKMSIVTVMDAEDGSILASATSPSYNPNSLTSDMSYQNPLISNAYEPGSVMKIYTYMCAIETGQYDGTKQFKSGSYEFEDGTVMHDWNETGWGYISYDNGFSHSSNVGIINIINDYLSGKKLKECLKSYGFGSKTGVELSGEEAGDISFTYETEIMSAGFGQGILTTPIQQLQGLSIIANDGVMISPHIISKVVNTNTKEETKTKVTKSKKLVSSSTISKIKDLMEGVIQPGSTGSKYYIEGYDIIGKTGTAQIYKNGAYLTGDNDYIVSIALMYPKDDPKIIIYIAAQQPSHSASSFLTEPTKELVKNISKYKAMFTEQEQAEESTKYTLSSYLNKNLITVKEELESKGINIITIGDGDKIIKQYPSKNTSILKGDKVFLITNSTNISMPDMSGWSRYDVKKYCELTNITCTFDGFGYVASQSIKANTKINSKTKLEILLGNVKEN